MAGVVDLKLTFAPRTFASLSRQNWIVCTQHPAAGHRGSRGGRRCTAGGVGTLKWSFRGYRGQREAVGLWDQTWSPGQCFLTASLCDACACAPQHRHAKYITWKTIERIVKQAFKKMKWATCPSYSCQMITSSHVTPIVYDCSPFAYRYAQVSTSHTHPCSMLFYLLHFNHNL